MSDVSDDHHVSALSERAELSIRVESGRRTRLEAARPLRRRDAMLAWFPGCEEGLISLAESNGRWRSIV